MDTTLWIKYLTIFIVSCSVSIQTNNATPTSLSLNGTRTETLSAIYCPQLDDGQNITCLINYGENSGSIWTEQTYNAPNCSSHTYNRSGYYEVSVFCVESNKVLNDSIKFYIGEAIYGVRVGDEYNSSFLRTPVNQELTILITFTSGTDVTVNVTDYDTKTDIYLTTNASSSDVINVPVQKSTAGQYIFEINLSNVVSSATRYVVVAVDEKIRGFTTTFSETNVVAMVQDKFYLDFSLTTGSNVVVAFEIGPVYLVEKCTGLLRNYVVNVTLTTAGIYTASLVLSNFVSQRIKYINFDIQYPVNNITVSAAKGVILATDTDQFNIQMLADALIPMGNLTAIVEINGNPSLYNLDLLPSNVTSIPFGPSPAGFYEIFVVIQSELTSLNFSWVEVVENSVDSLEFLYSSDVAMADGPQQIGVRITNPTVSPLYNLKCVFSIDGVDVVQETFNLTSGMDGNVTVQYTKDGNITIGYNCSNNLSWQADVGYVNLYTDCFKEGTLFNPLSKDKTKPIILYTTNVNTITGKAQVSESCYNSSRTYWWDLKEVYPNGSEILKSYYTFDENQPKSIVIAFAKESISVGLYSLHLTVNLTEIPGGFIADYLYVQFRYPEFVTGIAGGTERTISYNTALTLDAASKTEDLVTAISDPFIYAWKCKKKNATESEISAIIANYYSGEFLTYNSIPTVCNVPSSGGVVTVPTADLEAGFWFIYQVNTTKGDRTHEGIQAVYVSHGLVPNVVIGCTRNCLPKVSGDTRIVLGTSCAECQGRTTTYSWIIQKFNTTLNQYETIVDHSSIIESDINSDGLGIRANSLEESFGYRLQVTVDTGSPYLPVVITYQFKVNQPPYGGTCTISPTEGDASITIFSISCDGWLDEGYRNKRNPIDDNNEYLIYKVIQQRNDSINSIISESPESLIKSRLNVGDPNYDYFTTIIVRVTDSYNGYTDFTLTPKVRNPIGNDTLSTEDKVTSIGVFISTVIDEAELANDAGIFIQAAETIVSALNLQIVENITTYTVNQKPSEWNIGLLDVNDNQNLSTYQYLMDNLLRREEDKIQNVVKEGIRNLTSRMLSKLQEGNTSTYLMLELSSSAFANAISNSKFVSDDSAIDAATALQMIANSFANITENTLKQSIKSSTSEVESTAKSIFGLISNLVEVTVPENLNSSFFALSTSNMAISRQLVDFEAYLVGHPAYALAEEAKITPEERTGVYRLRARIQQYEIQQHHNLAKDTSPALIEAVGLITSSLLDTVCKSCKDIFLTSNVDTLLMKTEINKLQTTNILQSTEMKLSFKQGSNLEITAKLSLVSFHKSPFIYGPKLEDGASVTSLVNKITLTNEENKPITTTDKVRLRQPTEVVLNKYYEPTFTPGDASKLFYHVFYYRQLHDSVCFAIKPSLPIRISSYEVFLKQDNYPTHLQYDAKTYVAPERDWMACIGPSQLSVTGKTYIGLKPTPISAFVARRRLLGNGINATEASLSPYNFTIVTSACKSWDENKDQWDGSPCTMDWFPTESYIDCECSPTKEMTFANTFYVAPNTIDFSTVFLKFSPLNQAAVLATLCLIFVIYILLLIWARHQDKKDQVKWGVTPLADNFVDDTYYYLLTVYTGMRNGAGTRSRIGFILSGSDGDTGIRELYDGVRREMSTGSVMYYIMSVSEPLGELDYIYVWHDNSGGGSNASWYLARIDIEDIQKKERTIFLCGKWLAVESLDGSIDAVLPACGKDNLSTFKNMFYINAKDNLSNSHMWVSIFYRPTSSVYTRIQRVSCALVFIMLTMIANALYFSPEDDFENPNLVRVGPFVFSLQEVYVSIICALISTPATLLVILLFKKSKPRRLDNDIRDPASKYNVPVFGNWMETFMKDSKELEKTLVAKGILDTDETILPFWCVYIAWILVAAASIIPAFFIMLFSMEWGKQKSELWLSRFFLSFFESSFLLDPLKVLLMAVVFAIIFKQREKFKPTGLDRDIVLKNYRQRFGHKTGFRFPSPPLAAETIQKAREERQRDMKMMGSVKEVVVTLIFLWIIFSISYSNRDDRSYLLHRNIVKAILNPIEKTKPKFTEIKTTEQLIKWLNWTAFPALFPEKEYNSDQLHWRWRQYFSDLYNYRVGPPRLRQLRVAKEERYIPEFGNVVYYPNYNLLTETDADLCYGWNSPKCNLEMEAYSFSYGAWKHTSATDIWGVPVMGLYTTYGGGGYIAELDVNWSFSNRTLLELSQGLWFDRQTRAVFLEFVLYSPHLNIFTYNVFAAEFPDTGGVLPMYSIYPLRIYQHHGPTGTYMIFCEVMFVLFLLLLTVRVVWRFIQFRFLYFRNPWRTLDFVCITLGYIGTAMYVGRLLLANATMEKFAEDPKAFVNFQHIVFWDLLFIVLLGSLTFLATFRLLGILGYDRRIGEVFRVFSHCAYDLFWFSVLFFYLFVTYALLGYLLFGQNLESYSDVIESLSTLFISMIGKSRFTEIEESDPIMSKFYFFTFVIFLVYFMMTMFLAILCDSIDTVHKMTKRDRSDELVDYIIDQLKNMFASKGKSSHEKDQEFSSIPDERLTYVSLLNDLRDTIYTAFYDEKKPLNPPFPPESFKKKKMQTDSTSSEK